MRASLLALAFPTSWKLIELFVFKYLLTYSTKMVKLRYSQLETQVHLICNESSECELRTAEMLCEHPCLHSFCYKPEAYRTLCLQVPSCILFCYKLEAYRTLCLQVPSRLLDQDGQAQCR